jgi:predicted anti-sigma-YlaC factor YlaD
MKNILLACDEAKHYCDKTQYNESTLWEKIKLNVHLLYCKACRKYSAKNLKLTKLFNSKEKASLTTSEKENLQSVLDKEIAKHD